MGLPAIIIIVVPMHSYFYFFSGGQETTKCSLDLSSNIILEIQRYCCVVTRSSNEGSRGFKTYVQKRTLLGPSPCWKHIQALSHLRIYILRNYAKLVKLECRRKYHNPRAALRIYANQTSCPLWSLRRSPKFMSNYCGLPCDCKIFAKVRFKL